MKRFVLGIAWQAMGFLGAILLLCCAAPESWDYNGISGIIGSLLGLQLMLPMILCIGLFAAGLILCGKKNK